MKKVRINRSGKKEIECVYRNFDEASKIIRSLKVFPTVENVDKALRENIPEISGLSMTLRFYYRKIFKEEIDAKWNELTISITTKNLLNRLKKEKVNTGTLEKKIKDRIVARQDNKIKETIAEMQLVPTTKNISKILEENGYPINKSLVKSRMTANANLKKAKEKCRMRLIAGTIRDMESIPIARNIQKEFERKYGQDTFALEFVKELKTKKIKKEITNRWKKHIEKCNMKILLKDVTTGRIPVVRKTNELKSLYSQVYERIDALLIRTVNCMNGSATAETLLLELRKSGYEIGEAMVKRRASENANLRERMDSKKDMTIIEIVRNCGSRMNPENGTIPTSRYIAEKFRENGFGYKTESVADMMSKNDIKTEIRIALNKIFSGITNEEVFKKISAGEWELRYQHPALEYANQKIQERAETVINAYAEKMPEVPTYSALAKTMAQNGIEITEGIVSKIAKRDGSQIDSRMEKRGMEILGKTDDSELSQKVHFREYNMASMPQYFKEQYWLRIGKRIDKIIERYGKGIGAGTITRHLKAEGIYMNPVSVRKWIENKKLSLPRTEDSMENRECTENESIPQIEKIEMMKKIAMEQNIVERKNGKSQELGAGRKIEFVKNKIQKEKIIPA